MKVYLLQVVDWEMGERDTWGVYFTLEKAHEVGKRLLNNENLDISYKVASMQVQ